MPLCVAIRISTCVYSCAHHRNLQQFCRKCGCLCSGEEHTLVQAAAAWSQSIGAAPLTLTQMVCSRPTNSLIGKQLVTQSQSFSWRCAIKRGPETVRNYIYNLKLQPRHDPRTTRRLDNRTRAWLIIRIVWNQDLCPGALKVG